MLESLKYVVGVNTNLKESSALILDAHTATSEKDLEMDTEIGSDDENMLNDLIDKIPESDEVISDNPTDEELKKASKKLNLDEIVENFIPESRLQY